jgi:hypothetical protein
MLLLTIAVRGKVASQKCEKGRRSGKQVYVPYSLISLNCQEQALFVMVLKKNRGYSLAPLSLSVAHVTLQRDGKSNVSPMEGNIFEGALGPGHTSRSIEAHA